MEQIFLERITNGKEKFKVKYVADKYFARAARLVVFMAFVPICDIDDILNLTRILDT